MRLNMYWGCRLVRLDMYEGAKLGGILSDSDRQSERGYQGFCLARYWFITSVMGILDVLENEKKLEILDICVISALFLIACLLGKLCMNRFGDTWKAFNEPALGVLALGGIVWRQIRKLIKRKLEENHV